MKHRTFILIRQELSKALRGKGFWVSLAIGTAICLEHIWNHFTVGCGLIGETRFPLGPYRTETIFGQWIGMDCRLVENKLYLFLLPFLAALVYANSYVKERESGYWFQLIARGERGNYLLAKWVAVFVSAFLAVTLPLLLDFAVIAWDTPIRMPASIVGYFWEREEPMILLFYRHPMLYVCLYLFLIGVVAGCYASLSLAAAGIGFAGFSVWAAPMIVSLVIRYAAATWNVLEWDPSTYLMATIPISLHPFPLLTEIGAVLLLTGLLFYVKGKREEIIRR